jgi:hypothetical protein
MSKPKIYPVACNDTWNDIWAKVKNAFFLLDNIYVRTIPNDPAIRYTVSSFEIRFYSIVKKEACFIGSISIEQYE